jgi:hemerythrin-like domain-containing protein
MPSDAVDMLVVHRAFRREFHQMPGLISAVLAHDTARAKVVADHVKFMVAALHHHHAAEDDLVWPKLRSRAPAYEADVERMSEEHTEIAAAADHVTGLLPTWTRSAESALTEQLSAASGKLSACVDRHLDDEERNAVPLIEEHLTQQEWAATVKQAASFISARNLRLGIVLGGLVLDRASGDERRKILSGAPIPQRLVVRLFARRSLAAYRRRLYGVSG